MWVIGAVAACHGKTDDDSDGRTTQGVYTCCAPGDGLGCCNAEDGLLGYQSNPDGTITAVGGREDGMTSANCFRYGGTAGACASVGEVIEKKDICSTCCEALVELESECETGDCVEGIPGLPSVKICAACGDGTCGAGESHLNCPADCPPT